MTIIVESAFTRSIDRYIDEKRWDELEEAIDEIEIVNHSEKLSVIALILLKRLKS